ncbi:MAG: TIGR04104 family putative zinc finger protein [Sarcina sp.]
MRECPNCKEKISYKELCMSITYFAKYSYVKCDHCKTKYKINRFRRNLFLTLNILGIIACTQLRDLKFYLIFVLYCLMSPLFMSYKLTPYPTTK